MDPEDEKTKIRATRRSGRRGKKKGRDKYDGKSTELLVTAELDDSCRSLNLQLGMWVSL